MPESPTFTTLQAVFRLPLAIAWAGAEGLPIKTLSEDRAREFYEEATRGRSASRHLQAKAASRCSITS